MTSNFKLTLLTSVAAAAVTVMTAGTANATNGMLPHCVGTDRCGMGGAGLAMGTSATDAAINPALGAKVGNTYQINMGAFKANIKGEAKGNAANGPQSTKKQYFPNGSLGVNYVIDDKMNFNMYVGPGGGGAAYWAKSRTQTGAVDKTMDYKMIHLQPSVSFKSDGASYGVGAVLSRASINTNSAYGTVGSTANNSNSNFYGAGFHLGGVWDMAQGVKGALAYRSPIWHQHTGAAYNNLVFISPIDTPQQFSAGVAFEAAPGLTVAADGKYVTYSETETIGEETTRGGFGWENQLIVMLGVEYAMSDATTLRLGYNHGDSPISNSETWANFLYPAIVEDHFTVGASHDIGGGMSLGFSAYVTPEAKQTQDAAGAGGAAATGTYLKHSQKGFQLSFSNEF